MRTKWMLVGLALLFGAVVAAMPAPAGAELKVGISGYIKLDVQYSDKIITDGAGLPSPSPASTRLDGDRDADNSQTILDARETRVRVTFTDEVMGVKMSGRVETDFFTTDGSAGTSNSRHLRLRHAFARGDHPSGFFLLAGQYWSIFMNSDIAQPDLVDFNGPAGQIFARQPQLRVGWKSALGGGMGDLVLEAGAEKHSLENLGSATVAENQGEGQDIPLFVGKLSWLHSIFQGEVAGAAGNNRVILTGGRDQDETAWGIQVSAQLNLDPVTLMAHYQHGDGLSRLLNGDFPGAFLVGSEVRNVEADGWYAGASLKLTKDTSMTALYGWHEADRITSAGFTGSNQARHQSVHVNLLQKFWQRWQAGLEYRRFWVDTFDRQEGDVNIVHGALWFFF
ncbi:MAG: porin [Candidatus Rokubacteria bacterium]|nr:porin [Candidatus Rokubacteria bacterium]